MMEQEEPTRDDELQEQIDEAMVVQTTLDTEGWKTIHGIYQKMHGELLEELMKCPVEEIDATRKAVSKLNKFMTEVESILEKGRIAKREQVDQGESY